MRWVIVPLLAGTLGIVAAVGAFIGLLMVMGDEVGQPTEVDLKTRPPSFTLIGADAGDEWGRVALADVNGDGRDDLIAAAPKADGANNSRPDAGEAYIVFGPRSGTLDASQTQPDVVISGAEASDFLGRALAIGDLNGDGRDDVILGASADGPNNSRQDAGEVYVIMGSSAMPRAIDIAAGEQSVTVLGADAGDDAGKSVTAGDVNGDGMEDLIVGADDASGPGNSRPTAGEAYVIFGRRVLPGLVDIRTNEHDVTVLGAEGGDDLGQAVASGDLNGDGKGDLIVDADDAGGPNNGRTQAGEVYVIFGPLGGGKSVDIAAGEQQLTVFGADNGDNIGKDLSTGDVNGDGVEDIAIAAAAADGPSNARFKAGEVYIIFGAAGLSGSVDIRADEQDVKILGGEAADELGSSVSAQASFNSDDLADLLIGADDAGGPGNSRPKGGEAYVVYGSSSLPALIDVAQKAHPLAVFAADGGDDLGSFVAGGDLSGDGEADITIAAPGAAGPDNRRGKAGEIYTLNTGDPDGDSVLTFLDNCPEVRNADQADNDVDGVGDACESAGGAVPQSSGAAAGTGGQGGQVSRTGGDQRDGLRGGPGSGSGALSGSGRGAPAWAAAIVTLAAAGMLGGTAALVGRRRRSLRD